MHVPKRYPIFFLLVMTLLLLLSACSQPFTMSGGSNLSTGDVLQKSVDAMSHLKSSHMELQSNSSVQVFGNQAYANGLTGGSMMITASSDQALPNQQQIKVAINNTRMAQILKGEKVYVQNTTGRWYVMNKAAITNVVGNPFVAISIDQNTLLALVMTTRISDKGTEAVNGQNLRHIHAELDKAAIQRLFAENPQLRNMLGTQNINMVLKHIKSFASAIDVWINETTFYVHRIQLQLNLQTTDVKATLNTNLLVSNFNGQMNIMPPANAVPTNDPATIMGTNMKMHF